MAHRHRTQTRRPI